MRFSWCAASPEPDWRRPGGSAVERLSRRANGSVARERAARRNGLLPAVAVHDASADRSPLFAGALLAARGIAGVWRVGLTKFATRMLGDIVEFEFSAAPGSRDQRRRRDRLDRRAESGDQRVLGRGRAAFSEKERRSGRMSRSPNRIPTERAGCIDCRVTRRPTRSTFTDMSAILDLTIDKMLTSRHAGAGDAATAPE